MTPRTGRPKSVNPRSERLAIFMTQDELKEAEEAREKDKEPQKSLAAWFTKRFFDMLRKTKK